jgi:hypothetical protein
MQTQKTPKNGKSWLRILSVALMLIALSAAGPPFTTARAQIDQQAVKNYKAFLPLVSSRFSQPPRGPEPSPTPSPATSTAVPPSPTNPPASATPPPPSTQPAPTNTPPPTAPPPSGSSRIYWGAYIDGNQYNQDNPPWDLGAIDTFEQHTGKKISILHYGLPWASPAPCWPGSGGGSAYYPFVPTLMTALRSRGIIPMVDWGSWSMCNGTQFNTDQYTLSAIANGAHDTFIRQWAEAARDWGHPFFLRMNWEMNGNWFPWSEQAAGNGPGQYVQMWRHVHDIFTSVGAGNVTWVWCPNTVYQGATPLNQLYPGDAYVDWTCFDGYNFPPSDNDTGAWKTFSQVIKATYDQLLALSPNKPVMIGETSSTEAGGSKAEWIRDALTQQLPVAFPRIKALVWFNWNADNYDWVIETSGSAQSAFANGIASSYYTASDFSNLNTSPIPPP